MKFRKDEGVTLIVLTIIIIVLLIITSITFYSSTVQLGLKKVNNLYSDIDTISTKISAYYLENGNIPVLAGEYIPSKTAFSLLLKTNGATNEDINVNPNDEDSYLVIDLSQLDNLTLNYGKDYETWKTAISNGETPSYEDYQDIYIINSVTHQIYYPQGITYNSNAYFTRDADVGEINSNSENTVTDITDVDVNITNCEYTTITIDDEQKNIITANILLTLTSDYVESTLEYGFIEVDNEEKEEESAEASKETEEANSEENEEMEDENLEKAEETENINLENVKFTSFSLEGDNTAILTSKAMEEASSYYLFIKILDINGEAHYISKTITINV